MGFLPSSIRRAKYLILPVSILTTMLTGCKPPPQPPLMIRSVNVEELRRFHPLWKQVASLEAGEKHIRLTVAAASKPSFQPTPLPAVFNSSEIIPSNLSQDRAAQVSDDARKYIARLTKTLEAERKSRIEQETRRERRRIEAELASRFSEEERIQREIVEVKTFVIRSRIRSLTLRDIVLVSKINNYSQLSLQDTSLLEEARAEHNQIAAEIERLKGEIASLLKTDYTTIVAQKREALRKPLEAASATRLKEYEEKQRIEIEEQLTNARQSFAQIDLPAFGTSRTLPKNNKATPLPFAISPAKNAKPYVRTTPTHTNQGVDDKKRLLDLIDSDIHSSLKQIAAEKGWKLVNNGTKGASDATKEAVTVFRKIWMAQEQGKP